MYMRKIKTILTVTVITVITVMAVCLVGCGKDKNSSSKNKDVSDNSNKVQDNSNDNGVDMTSIISSININDQPMEFPIDITKLKESITLLNPEQTEDSNLYRATLMDGDAIIGVVNLYSESGAVETDGFIHFIEVTEGSPWYLSVKGVTYGASVADVKKSIGEPVFENGNESQTYRLYYENNSYEYISFVFEGGLLKTIGIEYMPEEWR